MELHRKRQMYVLSIGRNTSVLFRKDLQELHDLVKEALENDKGDVQVFGQTDPLMTRLKQMELGDEIVWPIGAVNPSCVRATASMVKRKTGKCFSCHRDVEKGTFSIKRFV